MCSLRCEVSQHFHIFGSIYNLQILFYMGHWKTGLSHLWPELKLLQEAKSEKLWSIGGAVWRKVQLIGRLDHFHSAYTISFVNDTVIKTLTTAWSFAHERGLLRFWVLWSNPYSDKWCTWAVRGCPEPSSPSPRPPRRQAASRGTPRCPGWFGWLFDRSTLCWSSMCTSGPFLSPVWNGYK